MEARRSGLPELNLYMHTCVSSIVLTSFDNILNFIIVRFEGLVTPIEVLTLNDKIAKMNNNNLKLPWP